MYLDKTFIWLFDVYTNDASITNYGIYNNNDNSRISLAWQRFTLSNSLSTLCIIIICKSEEEEEVYMEIIRAEHGTTTKCAKRKSMPIILMIIPVLLYTVHTANTSKAFQKIYNDIL